MGGLQLDGGRWRLHDAGRWRLHDAGRWRLHDAGRWRLHDALGRWLRPLPRRRERLHEGDEGVGLLDGDTGVEGGAQPLAHAEGRLGAEADHVALVRGDEEGLRRRDVAVEHAEGRVHVAALGSVADWCRIEAVAGLDGIVKGTRLARRAPLHLLEAALALDPAQHLAGRVDVKRRRSVPHRTAFHIDPPAQHARAAGLRRARREQVAPNDDDREARVANVLGCTCKGRADSRPVDTLRADVARHVDHQRHVVVKGRELVELVAVDRLV